MGRCGGWSKGITLALAVIAASCGGTGGGPSDSGKPLVFQARGRLNLIVQPTNDPRVVTLTATLLDPQGIPFRNQAISFTAEFQDATFIPGSDNQGSVRTNDTGQAKITLVAGLTTGHMRVLAEAPPALNIATGITVELTAQGFVSLGPLGIIPLEVTFINPLVGPDIPGPMTVFNATGGTPPYRWNNSNVDLGRLDDQNSPDETFANEKVAYTLIGPIPTEEVGEALQDTITLQDAVGDQATATVNVIFADCRLQADGSQFAVLGVPGRDFQVNVSDGVPPFTVTPNFPGSVEVSIVVLDQNGNIILSEECNQAGENCAIFFALSDPVRVVDPGVIIIRDSRGCAASIEYSVTPVPGPVVTTIILEANPLLINGLTGGASSITATVLDQDNQPIEGITVLFTDDHASAMTNPLTATTNTNGQAITALTVPPLTPAGVVRVTGSAVGVSGFVDVTIFIPPIGTSGPPDNIFVDLFADRSGDNNDGTCTTILSALVVDAEGNPVGDDTPVSWEAEPATGGIPVSVTSPSFTNQDPPCDISTYERDSGLEITPQPGDALACLKYPQSASERTVVISASSGAASGDFTIILPPCPPGDRTPVNLTLEANPNPIDLNGSETETSTITATLLNANSQPLMGISVLFTTTAGSFGSDPNQPITSMAMMTDEFGQAHATLTVTSADSTATVAAAAAGVVRTVDVAINP